MDFSDTTVVIPAKDEPAIVKVANGVLKSLDNCRVIILFNGYGGNPPAFSDKRVRCYSAPLGKGNAIIMLHRRRLVKTKIMCFIDGDATYEPRNLRRMVPLARERYGMVLGNRFRSIDRKAMPRFIEVGNGVITFFANLLYGMRLEDSQTGLRAMRTSAFESLDLQEKGFGIESEMNIKMRKAGFSIGEVDADYYVRIGETKQRKVIDGIKLLFIDFKFIFYKHRH